MPKSKKETYQGATDITITENNEDYKTQFKYNNADAEITNTKTFQLTDNAVLDVINTKNSILPTGIDLGTVKVLFVLAVLAVLNIIFVIRKKYVQIR